MCRNIGITTICLMTKFEVKIPKTAKRYFKLIKEIQVWPNAGNSKKMCKDSENKTLNLDEINKEMNRSEESTLYTHSYTTGTHRVEVVFKDKFIQKAKNQNSACIIMQLLKLGFKNLTTKDLGFCELGIDFKTYTEVFPYVQRPTICFNCLSFEHKNKYCNEPSICLNFSENYLLKKDEQGRVQGIIY